MHMGCQMAITQRDRDPDRDPDIIDDDSDTRSDIDYNSDDDLKTPHLFSLPT